MDADSQKARLRKTDYYINTRRIQFEKDSFKDLIFGHFLMLILSLSGSTPVPQNMAAEEMSLEEIKSCPEAEEYMTEYADAYITSDETMTYVVDTEKIHFKDENGKWQDIDNTIVADSEWDYRNKANDLKMLFKSDDEGIVSRLEKEGNSL